jgi:hypothetical protein
MNVWLSIPFSAHALKRGGAALLACVFLSGCLSSSRHREAADRSAEKLIAEVQVAGLGATEPFSVEHPIETFRKRLLLDQQLPFVGEASLGIDALVEPAHWPDTGEARNRPLVYMPAASALGEEPIRIRLVEALQLGAGHAREYQSRKESLFVVALQLDLEQYRFDHSFRGSVEGLFTVNE